VAADEALIATQRLDDLSLCRADVGDDDVLAAGRKRVPGELDQAGDGRGADYELGAVAGLADRGGGAGS
jgi:hypothetical protein